MYNYGFSVFGTNKNKIIGTCSLCGGPVTVPIFQWSMIQEIPQCAKCGAVKKQDYGPVIEMVSPAVKP